MKIFYFILLIIFLTSCTQNLFKTKLNPNLVNKKSAYVKVKDIECEFCADTVINLLSSVNGVTNAKLEYNDTDWDKNRIELTYNSDSIIDQTIIKQALNQDSFELEDIKYNY